MKRLLILPLIGVIGLSCFIVETSEAAEITSLSVYSYDDAGSGATVSASLTADEGIDYIDWYINDVYKRASMHSGDTTSVSVNVGNVNGSIKGEKYTIKAVAWFYDEANETFVNDTETDNIRVYRPISDSGYKVDVNGTASLYSQTFDGSSFGMSGSMWGYNPTNKARLASGKFRLTVWKDGAQVGDPEEQVPPAKTLNQGDTYSASGGPSKSIGRPIRPGETYTTNAYVRIFVGTQTWVVDNPESFNDSDNPN